MTRVLREAGWAPLAVLVLAWVTGHLPIARDVWWLFHALGGAALAFACARALAAAQPGTRYLSAFGFAVAGALAWELAEFAWDRAFGTRLQQGYGDTISDLYLSACGAALYLSFAALPGRERQARDEPAR
jgi:hypothetical protein